MKKNLLYIVLGCALTITAGSCSKDHDHNNKPTDPNTGAKFSVTGDVAGRPGVNIVFISTADKDKFNSTAPAAMGTAFQSQIQAKILSLNPGYTTNFRGLTATQFSTLLATDVLNVNTTGTTTYYDGTNILTGRQLGDDVIDASFKLIWGGPSGTANPQLTSDHVDHNDKPFLTAFPYEAAPW